jgi:hypothetical protein
MRPPGEPPKYWMKKIIALAIGLLALSGCEQQKTPAPTEPKANAPEPNYAPAPIQKKTSRIVSRLAADGYYFEKNALRINARPIKIVVYSDVKSLRAGYAKINGRTLAANEELFGFGVINQSACTLHLIDPKTRYMPEELGHELTHCLYGEFHPSQNER